MTTEISDEQKVEIEQYISTMTAQWADFIDLLDSAGVLPPTNPPYIKGGEVLLTTHTFNPPNKGNQSNE